MADSTHPLTLVPTRPVTRPVTRLLSLPALPLAPALLLASALVMALVMALALPAAAQLPVGEPEPTLDYYFPDGESFDAAIPSPAEFLGYEIGMHHTRHDRIVAYMQELARLSERATYQEIGRTVGHRVLPVLTVTSPQNHARLEEIRTAHLAALGVSHEPGGVGAPAGGPPAGGPGAATDRPAIVHLGYGVHGNETSSSETALLTAYWLVAGTSAEVQGFLRDGVFHVEPVLNPDGRDRHSHWANMHKGNPFVVDPLDREHNEAWPNGRTHHYWFDLNRDWLPLQAPESRARIEWHHRWHPNVVTDYHEMGTNSTYFFEPTKPEGSWNPLLPEELYTDITLRFAEHWAASLDELGSLYFTKEVFDNTYPGYGSTYPNFLGGLGLVFEQASARGHAQTSTHHGVLTFPYTIRNQLRTSLATVRAAIEHRERMHEYQLDFYRSGLDEARGFPVREWVFGDTRDASKNREFLDLLLRHRIQVFELPESREVEGERFEAGSAWVVPVEQPGYRMVRSIFERTETYADSVFYDASTWTMSLAYGIPHAALTTGAVPRGNQVTEVPRPQGLGVVPESGYAYLLDWSDYYAPRALQYLLARGVRAEVAMQPFTARTNRGEYPFPAGSISIPVQVQSLDPGTLHRLVREAEAHAGLPFLSTETGYSVEGIDLGSGNVRPIPHAPRTLMIVGAGINANEAGQVWHLLDTRVDLPLTKVDRDHVGRIHFPDYDVVVLVSGNYGMLQGETLEALRRWVRDGGTLVAVRQAAEWAIQQGLAPRVTQALEEGDAAWARAGVGAEAGAAAPEGADRPPLSGVDSRGNLLPARIDWADAGPLAGAQRIGGSIYRADLDPTHPIGFGFQGREIAVWRDHEIFLPPSANPFATPVQLAAAPHLSGYIAPVSLDRIRNSASILTDQVGSGSVVLMLDNPNFRGYWFGTNRLFLNALYFGRHMSVPGAP